MNSLVTTNQPNPQPKKNKGGRPKGSRNRSNYLLKQAQDEIEKLFGTKDFDPVIFLASIAADANRPIEVRIVAASKAAPYMHSPAKPAVIDDSGKKKPVNLEAIMSRVAKDLMIEGKIPTKEELSDQDADDGLDAEEMSEDGE